MQQQTDASDGGASVAEAAAAEAVSEEIFSIVQVLEAGAVVARLTI